MSAAAKLRRGWCPSVARPMPSGDGLLVRLSTPGRQRAARARSRHRLLRAALRQRPHRSDAPRQSAIARRRRGDNAGLDRRAFLARRAAAGGRARGRAQHRCVAARGSRPRGALRCPADRPRLARMSRERTACFVPCRRSSASSSRMAAELGLDDIAADIRFKPSRSPAGLSFTVALGADEGVAQASATCAPAEIPDARGRAGPCLPRTAWRGRRRRRAAWPQLVSRVGCAKRSCGQPDSKRGTSPRQRSPEEPLALSCRNAAPPIGVFDLGPGKRVYLGIGAPFGRLTADQLDALAGLAEASGADIRLTPWRAILVANLSIVKAKAIFAKLEGSGFVTEARRSEAQHRRLSRKPGLRQRHGLAARRRARTSLPWRKSFGRGLVGLHISGCAKGCARGARDESDLGRP